MRFHLITPAGKGEGQIKETLFALKKSDYKGFLSLEPHFYPLSDSLKASLDPVYSKKQQMHRKRSSRN